MREVLIPQELAARFEAERQALAMMDHPNIARVRDPGGKLTLAIHDCRKPVIAAINGAAVGVGATMTLAMDRRLISTQGRIGLIFGRIGVTPEAASSWFLERIVGQSAALDLVLRADIIDAAAAAAVGLVDEVVEPDALLSRAIEVAEENVAAGLLPALTESIRSHRELGVSHRGDDDASGSGPPNAPSDGNTSS